MKLSEYIKRLQTIQRKMDDDPEVCIVRFSDFTTDIESTDDTPPEKLPESERYPQVVKARPFGYHLIRHHPSMPEHEQRECRDYVLLSIGN